MTDRNRGYIHDVDELIRSTPFERVTDRYGLPAPGDSSEYRINCVFREECRASTYGNLDRAAR